MALGVLFHERRVVQGCLVPEPGHCAVKPVMNQLRAGVLHLRKGSKEEGKTYLKIRTHMKLDLRCPQRLGDTDSSVNWHSHRSTEVSPGGAWGPRTTSHDAKTREVGLCDGRNPAQVLTLHLLGLCSAT